MTKNSDRYDSIHNDDCCVCGFKKCKCYERQAILDTMSIEAIKSYVTNRSLKEQAHRDKERKAKEQKLRDLELQVATLKRELNP